tara:strand:+ start:4001 stop:4249 length:249 start_codon:yes stop_codon:yes gene_type:complete
MSSEMNTLAHREESMGRRYPLVVERLLFIFACIGFYFLYPYALDVGEGILGSIAAWCGLPLLLLMCVELIGRMVQTIHSSGE